MLHQSEKSYDISQEHKTNGEFTCRTELVSKLAETRQITDIGWGGATRGAGGGIEDEVSKCNAN